MSKAMEIEKVVFYGRLEYTTGTATPKYVLTKQFGDYPPIDALIGRDAKVSFFLQQYLVKFYSNVSYSSI